MFGDHFVLLGGFRAIDLPDDIRYDLNSTVAEGDYNYKNHLYGGQIGAEFNLFKPTSPLQVAFDGKIGLFNAQRQRRHL